MCATHTHTHFHTNMHAKVSWPSTSLSLPRPLPWLAVEVHWAHSPIAAITFTATACHQLLLNTSLGDSSPKKLHTHTRTLSSMLQVYVCRFCRLCPNMTLHPHARSYGSLSQSSGQPAKWRQLWRTDKLTEKRHTHTHTHAAQAALDKLSQLVAWRGTCVADSC